jgi:hypothetical protein
MVSTVVGVALAALAGVGIGALRPLGRRSELLLLPFAPWLFVGTAPLVRANMGNAIDDHTLTWLDLVPPSWLPVPALFVFALLGHGLRRRWLHRRAAGSSPVAATMAAVTAGLPMLGLIVAITWVVKAQDSVWSLMKGSVGPLLTGPALAHIWASSFYLMPLPLGLVFPAAAIVVLAVGLGALQLAYLDRLAIRAR